MTYKNLKKFLTENTFTNIKLLFDLMPQGVKSKVIFSVGEGSHITSTLISSIMSECDIPHSRYIKHDEYELKNRFVRQNESINITELCKTADHLLQKAKQPFDKSKFETQDIKEKI